MTVIALSLQLIESLIGTLPEVQAVLERYSINHFVGKGFPRATIGKELVAIEPMWMQDISIANKFQLYVKQDFSTLESPNCKLMIFRLRSVFSRASQINN